MGILSSDEFRRRAAAAGEETRRRHADRSHDLSTQLDFEAAERIRREEHTRSELGRLSLLGVELAAAAKGRVPFNREFYTTPIKRNLLGNVKKTTPLIDDYGWAVGYHIEPARTISEDDAAVHTELVLCEHGGLYRRPADGLTYRDEKPVFINDKNFDQHSVRVSTLEGLHAAFPSIIAGTAPFTLDSVQRFLEGFAGYNGLA